MTNPDHRGWVRTDGNAYGTGGGRWNYGQQGVQSFLDGFFPVTDDTPPFGMALLPTIERSLSMLPLDVLRLFKPFTRGTTDIDWQTQDTAVAAILNTFHPRGNPLQELIDGIAGLFKPGASNTPISDAIAVLLGIKTTAEIAQEHAALALIGVEGIKAQQAGGWFDEFDYPLADTLPPNLYTPFYEGAGNGTYGPSGTGYLVYKPRGIGARGVTYRRDVNPIVGPNGTVTVVLSNAPAAIATTAYVYICGKWAAADQSRLQARINQNAVQNTSTVQFQVVNAAGVPTDVGTPNTLPRMADGDVLAMKWTGNEVELRRNDIVAHTVTVNNMPTGDRIGFGAYVPNYALPPHPGAEFKGMAYHPNP